MSPSDIAGVTSFFTTPNEGFTTTLGETISSGATTVPLNSTTGLVNGTVFVGIIEPGATNEQVFTGIVNVSDLEITGVIWTRGTDVGHTGGVTIVDYVTGTAFKMMTAGITVDHNQAGYHLQLHDANGAVWIDQGATASAVNNIKVSNNSTGNAPIIAAEGSDSNISLDLNSKGADPVLVNGNPPWTLLGTAYNTAGFSTANTTATLVTGLTLTVTIPTTASKVRIIGFAQDMYTSGSTVQLTIWSGTPNVGTKLAGTIGNNGGTSAITFPGPSPRAVITASSGSQTYTIGFQTNSGTGSIDGGTTTPACITVECC